MKRLLLSFLLISFFGVLFAGNVELTEAKQIAKNAYFQKLNTFVGSVDMGEINISNVYTIEGNGQAAIYVFNVDNYGFILISAEDAIEPIIGYSLDTKYNDEKQSEGFAGLMSEYTEHIGYLRDNSIAASDVINQQWNELKDFETTSYVPQKGSKDIEPMLTATWNQDWPYNYLCPEDESGPGGHVYVGCVSTAMCQIMQYWRYPLQGSGSYSYYQYPYGTLSANFGETEYDWDGMVDNSDSYVNYPMALIGYQAAVAVEMDFGWDGSGAYSTDVPYALETYFGYATACQYKDRQGTALSTWKSWAQSELEDRCPIYYSGRDSNNGGHAFVLDGYHDSDEMYHFNFGWSGYENGWYLITDAGGFSIQQGMVINIYPGDADYPYGCTPDYERLSMVGSFEDGSGPAENYDANADCSWLINPQTDTDSVSYIKLNFVEMDTDPADVITIYDGPNTESPVLGTYSGTTLPTELVQSTGNTMFVTFEADGNSTTAPGWKVEYSSMLPTYCSGLTNHTSPVGNFEDGSLNFNYRNNTNCMWKIEPAYANGLTLMFNEFDTEADADILKVYDASNNQLLGQYSGSDIPDDIYVESGKLFITFQSNGYVSGAGFNADWEVGNVSVEENSSFENLSVFPNPASETLTITFTMEQNESVGLRLISVTGEVVYEEQATDYSGTYINTINLSDLAKGVYFLNMTGDNGTMNKKIVVK